MANPEHLELLKQGSEVWYMWRREQPDVVPNLIDSDLRGADLNYVDFSRTVLMGADLSGTNLRGASLADANLSGGRLCGADLRDANLLGIYFRRTDLRDVNFRGANLAGADLSETHLSGADFTDVRMAFTTFADNDLRQVKGLETVDHRAPSSIGLDTIYKSQGKIPEVFLRGCGVPEDFITYMRSLTAQPIQFYTCFISLWWQLLKTT